MDANMNVAVIPPVSDLDAFANYYIDKVGLQPEQVSYLVVREHKVNVTAALQAKELEAQQILLKPGETIVEIEESIKKYRAIYVSMVEDYRKKFTNFIRDNITEPTTEPEKRVNPEYNPEFKALSSKLLEMKVEDQKKKADAAKKINEISSFLAHIKNETLNIITEYKTACFNEINKMYEFWLTGKNETPEVDVLKEAIKEIKVREPKIMQRQYLGDEEAGQLYIKWLESEEFFQISQDELTEEALKFVDEKMELYANDLALVKSKPEVVAEIKKADQEQVTKLNEDAKTQTSVNTLVSSASQPSFGFTSEYKGIKEYYEIAQENTREFAIKIMTIFCANPDLSKFLSIRDWKNLKVEQMTSAIAKYASEDGGKKFPELIYSKCKK